MSNSDDSKTEHTAVDATRWSQVKEMFTHLHDKSPSHRSDYLTLMCEDDPSLRLEVESLLRAHDGISLMPDTAATPARETPSHIEGFQLFEQLGQGGAGTVYRAEHPHLGEVALKLLPAETLHDPTARARFEQEASALEKLQHPALCGLLDTFVNADYAGLAMEHVTGRSLSQCLADEGAMSWQDTLHIMKNLLSVVSMAHEHGIVHRDIKPSNVMQTDGGDIKLIDFGIAKFADNRLTRTGQMMGSPRYMSPEQWRGSGIDHRTDQWSLGVLWYELLSGEPAFSAERLNDVATQVLQQEPAALPAHGVDGTDLQDSATVIQRLLRKEADQRFHSVAEVLDAVQALRPAR